MDDQRRRTADRAVGTRVTVVEVELTALARRFERHIDDNSKLIARLDDRADRQDIAMARLLAALSAVMVLANLLAPFLQRLVGLPT